MIQFAGVAIVLTQIQVPRGFQEVKFWSDISEGHDNEAVYVEKQGQKIILQTEKEYIDTRNERQNIAHRMGKMIEEPYFHTWLVPNSGVKIDQGFYYPVNEGEWGGALYFQRAKTATFQRIAWGNFLVVDQFGSKLYAINGIAHMSANLGTLVRIEKKNHKWTTEDVTDLHGCPTAVASDGKRFLFAKDNYVTSLNRDGTQREIGNSVGRDFQCHSLAVDSSGNIWCGCSWGLAIYEKSAKGYSEHLFTRK